MGLLDFGAENHTGVFAKAVSKGERVQLHEAIQNHMQDLELRWQWVVEHERSMRPFLREGRRSPS